MNIELATRNLVHEKISEFPEAQGADEFLTKEQIMNETLLANVTQGEKNEFPIMDWVERSAVVFTSDISTVNLPQDTSGIIVAITSSIRGTAVDWSISSQSDWINVRKNGNEISVSAKESQTSDVEKTGSFVLTQNTSGQTLTISVRQAAGVITWEYVFSISPTSYSAPTDGGSVTVNITSYKKKIINGVDSGYTETVGVSVGYQSGDNFNSINRDNLPSSCVISSGRNDSESSKSEVDRFTQSESGKTIDFTYSQAAVSWNYYFNANSSTLNFPALGGSITPSMNSYKLKVINGVETSERVEVGWSCTSVSNTSIASYSSQNFSMVENQSVGARVATGVTTQHESGRTFTLTLSQAAASVRYEYQFSVSQSILEWNWDEVAITKSSIVTSVKVRYVNYTKMETKNVNWTASWDTSQGDERFTVNGPYVNNQYEFYCNNENQASYIYNNAYVLVQKESGRQVSIMCRQWSVDDPMP